MWNGSSAGMCKDTSSYIENNERHLGHISFLIVNITTTTTDECSSSVKWNKSMPSVYFFGDVFLPQWLIIEDCSKPNYMPPSCLLTLKHRLSRRSQSADTDKRKRSMKERKRNIVYGRKKKSCNDWKFCRWFQCWEQNWTLLTGGFCCIAFPWQRGSTDQCNPICTADGWIGRHSSWACNIKVRVGSTGSSCSPEFWTALRIMCLSV